MALKIYITLLVLCTAHWADAQRLLFVHSQSKKTIQIVPGHMLCVSYIGYNGVKEFAKLLVTDITDSTITLGTDPDLQPWYASRKDGAHLNTYKVIRISDIIAFRKMTLGRVALKATLRIGIVVAAYFFIYELSQNEAYSPGAIFGISAAIGIGGTLLTNALLPENAKYQLRDGWQVRFLPD